jgi:Holliday junction resolvase
MNKNYIRGRECEYKIMRLLEKANYICYRTAGSHSAWDIIADSETESLRIQSKRSKTELPLTTYKEDIEKMRAVKVMSGIEKQLWLYTDRKGWKIFRVLPESIEVINK